MWGNHGFACHKFNCFKCRQKGHVHRDCKKDQICFYYHHPGHFRSCYPTIGMEGVHVPMLRRLKSSHKKFQVRNLISNYVMILWLINGSPCCYP